jgi:hypothetical protein
LPADIRNQHRIFFCYMANFKFHGGKYTAPGLPVTPSKISLALHFPSPLGKVAEGRMRPGEQPPHRASLGAGTILSVLTLLCVFLNHGGTKAHKGKRQ